MRHQGTGEWVGARLRELREAQGLSQRGLAIRSGVTTEMVSRAEKNAKTPSVPTLARLCEGLGLSLGEFFGSSDAAVSVPRLDGVVGLLDGVEAASRQQVLDGFKSIAKGVRRLASSKSSPPVRRTSARRRG